jgi:hypothetical protein
MASVELAPPSAARSRMSRPARRRAAPARPPERPRLLDATNPPVLNDVLFASRDVAERFGGRVAVAGAEPAGSPGPRDHQPAGGPEARESSIRATHPGCFARWRGPRDADPVTAAGADRSAEDSGAIVGWPPLEARLPARAGRCTRPSARSSMPIKGASTTWRGGTTARPCTGRAATSPIRCGTCGARRSWAASPGGGPGRGRRGAGGGPRVGLPLLGLAAHAKACRGVPVDPVAARPAAPGS